MPNQIQPREDKGVVARKVRGTILVNRNGNRNVAYLVFNDGKWQLNWNWLDNKFNRNYRFLRFRNLHP